MSDDTKLREAAERAARKWLSNYVGSIDSTALLLAVRVGYLRGHADGAARVAELEAEAVAAERWRDDLLAWQDAVTSEVLMHPDLPCGGDEVGIGDVPALLAVMAGRIDHPDDYEDPPHVPSEDEVATEEPPNG